MIIREALAAACIDLKAAGIETPSLDASLLLSAVLKTGRTALAAMGSDPLSQEAFAAFRALIERRLNGECAAYILGKKEFRGLEFLVNPSVLVPRPDTETLVEAALEAITGSVELGAGNKYRVLDLCTGSGAIAIALKNEMPELEVWAADISAEALETAKANAARLLPSGSIQFYSGDLYNALPRSQFNLIVSNPPYVSSDEIKTLSAEVQKEPRLALDGGISGLEIIKRIIDGSPVYLKRGGILLLEAGPRQMKDITILLEKKGFKDIKLYRDLLGLQRVIGGKYEEQN
jgi:release factor glutamine methyltransferase